MAGSRQDDASQGIEGAAVRITNPQGASRFVIACEHASNFIPPQFGALGLSNAERQMHIAWDPGALPVARRMAEILDAPLVESCVSRLVIDCNRPLDAPDLIPELSETTVIPGNRGLSPAERQARIAASWTPFHDALSGLIADRQAGGGQPALVTIHSYTPVWKGVPRPWHAGIIHDDDDRLALPLIAALQNISGLCVGINEPYAPKDRVYFTLERHARPLGLECVMVEIRNDEIASPASQQKWAETLTKALADTRSAARPDTVNSGSRKHA